MSRRPDPVDPVALTDEELDAQRGEALPHREAMSIIRNPFEPHLPVEPVGPIEPAEGSTPVEDSRSIDVYRT